MKLFPAWVLLGAIITNGATAADDSFSVEGVLYVTYNNGVYDDKHHELSARLVPNGPAMAALPGSLEPSQPIRHFNIDNASKVVDALVGRRELAKLAKDTYRVAAVPITAVLTKTRRVMECDSPADYATLVSAKAQVKSKPVSRDDAPIGC